MEGAEQKPINLHAWGVWTALTEEMDEEFDGQMLRVFETWETPSDVQSAAQEAIAPAGRTPRPLTLPTQLGSVAGSQAAITNGEQTVLGFVKYDPSAVGFIQANSLLTPNGGLSKLRSEHEREIP